MARVLPSPGHLSQLTQSGLGQTGLAHPHPRAASSQALRRPGDSQVQKHTLVLSFPASPTDLLSTSTREGAPTNVLGPYPTGTQPVPSQQNLKPTSTKKLSKGNFQGPGRQRLPQGPVSTSATLFPSPRAHKGRKHSECLPPSS